MEEAAVLVYLAVTDKNYLPSFSSSLNTTNKKDVSSEQRKQSGNYRHHIEDKASSVVLRYKRIGINNTAVSESANTSL